MTEKRKRKIDPNLIIAIGVLICSFAALFVYIHQARIMREQTKILLEQTKSSSWPNLSIQLNRSFSQGDVLGFEFIIANRGTGPAIVNSAVISFDGEPASNWAHVYQLANVPDSILQQHFNDSVYDLIIPPNEEFKLIGWTGYPEIMNYMYEVSDKISIQLCYSSVYDDHWLVKREGMKTNLEKNIREKTDECSILGPALFEE